MRERVLEFVVGLFILAGVAALVMLAVKVSGLTTYVGDDGMILYARFDDVGDLKVRAPVSMAGVRIGQVQSINLDKTTYQAFVTLFIEHETPPLPIDTSARILTEGLVGSNYLSLTPGVQDAMTLKNKGTIMTTHSALILENLIGEFLFKITKPENTKN